MDPISQAALGSAVAGVACWKKLGRWSLALGASGGALADIDVLWGGLGDPALPWELHRHFTHSLIFIPLGGLLAALPFLGFKGVKEHRKFAVLAATIGYATHGVLDTATSWGTYLYWPFLDERVGWDWISVIDPLFTMPLLIGIGWASLRPEKRHANTAGLVLALLYLGFGVAQNQRGLSAQEQLAERRGHTMEDRQVMPLIGNLVLWRSIYVHDGRVFVDGLRLIPGKQPAWIQGTSKPQYDPDAESLSDRQRDVLRRLRQFSEGYLVEEDSGLIGDQRFSFDLIGFRALWGVRLERGVKVQRGVKQQPAGSADEVTWHDTPVPEEAWGQLMDALFQGTGFEPLE